MFTVNLVNRVGSILCMSDRLVLVLHQSRMLMCTVSIYRLNCGAQTLRSVDSGYYECGVWVGKKTKHNLLRRLAVSPKLRVD